MKTKNQIAIIISSILMMLFFTTGLHAEKKKDEVIKIKTSAVCGSCKTRIEKGLSGQKGITEATLDVDTKIVTVKYSPSKTTPDEIRLAISKIGYNADGVLADKAAYDKLPNCCKTGCADHK